MERSTRGCQTLGGKQGVDSRDEVRHSEKTDQLFLKMTIKATGKCVTKVTEKK